MALKVKVSPRDDGVDITIDGYIIEITVKPLETLPEASIAPTPIQLTGAAIEEPVEALQGEPVALSDTFLEDLKLDLSSYSEDLVITEEQDHVVVTPRLFLGRKKFNSVASIIEEMGGYYVSAGRGSRFLVPRKKQE